MVFDGFDCGLKCSLMVRYFHVFLTMRYIFWDEPKHPVACFICHGKQWMFARVLKGFDPQPSVTLPQPLPAGLVSFSKCV